MGTGWRWRVTLPAEIPTSQEVMCFEEQRMGRKFIGAELKKSYFEQAARNLTLAVSQDQRSMDFAAVR